MLIDRLAEHDVTVWLVNTGWTGGPFGTGERMNIGTPARWSERPSTVRLATSRCAGTPVFRVDVPTSCPDVPSSVLDPRSTWADAEAYDDTANRLAAMFAANFEAYADGTAPAIGDAGPVARPGTPRITVESDPPRAERERGSVPGGPPKQAAVHDVGCEAGDAQADEGERAQDDRRREDYDDGDGDELADQAGLPSVSACQPADRCFQPRYANSTPRASGATIRPNGMATMMRGCRGP
jgi:hypothetical protein